MSDPINTDGLLIVRHGPDPFSLGTLDDFRRLTEIDPDFISHTASRQHIRSLLIDMVTELHRQHAEIERLTVEREKRQKPRRTAPSKLRAPPHGA